MRVLSITLFWSRVALVVAVCCYGSVTLLGQQREKKPAKPSSDDTKILQQQELIGRLVGIVNELKAETDKPAAALLQSEIADVLWRFDEPAARSIFRLAFDTVRDEMASNSSEANSNKDSVNQSRRRVSAIRTILKRYGLRDRRSADAWFGEFENDVKSKQKSPGGGYRMSAEQAELLADLAAAMVSQDAKEAQRLGSLSLSGARIPSSFGHLLMALRSKDKALSDILFRQAVLVMRSNEFSYDQALIPLTNYTFFSSGMVFPDMSTAYVELITQYFVDAAVAQAARARSGAVRSSDEQASLGSFYSFFSNRASRIVALNAPDKADLFQSNLRDLAQSLTVDQQRQAEMLASLAQPNTDQTSEGNSDIESRIRRAEQEKNVANRDFLFRSLAMQLMRTEPERALDVARKIDDQDLRAQTEDDVYLILLRKAFANRDDAEARTVALKFNDPQRRARWLTEIAASLRSKDNTETAQLLSQAHSIAAKSDNTPVKMDVLLFIAKEFVRFDQDRGFDVFSEAVNVSNKLEKVSAKPKSSVPMVRVISMTVVDGQEVSTDDRVTLDSIDFNQISAFAQRDYLRTSYLGNDIKDRLLRSKYFIALARSVLQVPRQGSGYERTLEDLISN